MTWNTIRRKPQILTLWATSEGASPARVSRGVGRWFEKSLVSSGWLHLTYYIYIVCIYSVCVYIYSVYIYIYCVYILCIYIYIFIVCIYIICIYSLLYIYILYILHIYIYTTWGPRAIAKLCEVGANNYDSRVYGRYIVFMGVISQLISKE